MRKNSKNRCLIELLYLELTDSCKIADCVGVGGFSPNPHTSYLGPHALKVKNISHNVPIGRGFVTHIFYYVQFFYIILSSCMYYTCTVYVVYSPFQLVLAQLLYYIQPFVLFSAQILYYVHFSIILAQLL